MSIRVGNKRYRTAAKQIVQPPVAARLCNRRARELIAKRRRSLDWESGKHMKTSNPESIGKKPR